MPAEVLTALDPRPDGRYVDATFGRGGHARELLKRLGPDGWLLAIDRDPLACAAAQKEFGGDRRVFIERGPFSMLERYVDRQGWSGRVDGILIDLGVSSPQLEDPARGFSFLRDGPLDMRMDPDAGAPAADWVNSAPETELVRVIREYGEERFATRIARAILRERAEAPIDTTGRLAAIVAGAVPAREPGKHPATRTFQAVRMHINRELDELAAALPQALRALAPRGRLVIISFHSLEDRMVKRFLRAAARGDDYPPDMPVRADQLCPRLRLVGRALRPGAAEIARNPRARSAVLRAAERTEVAIA